MKFFLAKGEFKVGSYCGYHIQQRDKWVSEEKDTAIYPYEKSGYHSYGDDTDYVFFGVVTSLDINCKQVGQLIQQKIIEPKKYELVGNLDVIEESFNSALNEDECRGYLESDTYLSQFFNMREYIRLIRHAQGFFYNYLLNDSKTKSELTKAADNSQYSNALKAEFSRINKTSSEDNNYMIPAHYIIEGDNPNKYNFATDALLGVLNKNNRLYSNQVSFFDFDALSRWDSYSSVCKSPDKILPLINDAFADVLQFNTVIVKYGVFDNDSDFSTEAYAVFNALLGLLSERADTIQTIFIIPQGSRDLANRISKRFSRPIVKIKPDEHPKANTLSQSRALSVVKSLAAKDGMQANSNMENMLAQYMSNKSFSDLQGFYNDWKMLTLVEKKYPQYIDEVKAVLENKQLDRSKGAFEQLEEMIGLKGVKNQINQVIQRSKMNKELEQKGLPTQMFSMHLAFTGAPGTGKTEVARLYAEILKEEGILSEGRLIVRSGGSGFNVKEAFEEAKGSVLFIDEAYGMAGFNSTNITEFIAQMENNRHDTVVILAGYKGAIEGLLRCNPGFKSRLGFTIDFPEYTAEEKLEIFKLMARRSQMALPDEAISELRDIFERGGSSNDEGNGRFVRKLFEDSVGAQQLRLSENRPKRGYTKGMLLELTATDIKKAASKQTHDETGREALAGLIGLDDVKRLVSDRLDFMRVQKIKRDLEMNTPFLPMHMLFTGNPGSGKTEVARLIARILKEEGVLSVGECHEYLGNDFLVEPSLIEKYFEEAKGSVIFVDEAYTLATYPIGVASFIAAMENYREEVVVILAGYKDEMKILVDTNPGFDSRIKTKMDFPDYSTDELVDILKYMVKKGGFTVDSSAINKAREILEKATKQNNFGNARFVRNLFEKAIIAQGVRIAKGKTPLSELANIGASDDEKNAKEVRRQLLSLCAEDFQYDAAEVDERPRSMFYKDFGGEEIGFRRAF